MLNKEKVTLIVIAVIIAVIISALISLGLAKNVETRIGGGQQHQKGDSEESINQFLNEQ